MPRLYTKRDINEVLRELRIKPIEDRVNSQEAAEVLSWRAKNEHNIDAHYTDSTVRRHVALKNLKDIKRISDRQSLYSLEELFMVPLRPRRKKTEPA